MTRRLRLLLGSVVLVVPLLQGCLGALVAVQAIPAAMGGVAAANSSDRSPFIEEVPQGPGGPDRDLAALGTRIRRAECGDPEAQYWLAARLNNGFNAAPDYVEVYKWYRLAEMGGFSAASGRIAALDATLPVTQVVEARTRVARWRPATENCPA